MTIPFLEHALNRIQSSDKERVLFEAPKAALYLAMAGYLSEANSIISKLIQSGGIDLDYVASIFQAMEVLWAVDGQRPQGLPLPSADLDLLERRHRLFFGMNRWAIPLKTGHWQTLSDLDLFRVCTRMVVPDEDGKMPEAATELEALQGLMKFIGAYTRAQPFYLYTYALCLSAELAARNGLFDEALSYARLFIKASSSYDELYLLASNRHLAPLILKGSLQEELGFNADNGQYYSKRLLTTLEERITLGPKLVYADWSWQELLQRISDTVLNNRDDFEVYADLKWLGFSAASEEVIAETEKRLGLSLPEDYRAFLATSNGFVELIHCDAPGLAPVEQIDFLHRLGDPETLTIFIENYPEDSIPSVIDRCIVISENCQDIPEMVLLIPPVAPETAWQTWFFAHWVPGEESYRSFRHYIEGMYQKLQERTDFINK